MKRFYKFVSVRSCPEGYAIFLDDKPVRTPGGKMLVSGSESLAHAVLEEWAAQEEKILPDNMPLTQLLTTRRDSVEGRREQLTGAILKYLNTDLLCYRTDTPPDIGKKQAEAWDPWLKWFENRFGNSLETTTGLTALQQPDGAHHGVSVCVNGLDEDHFTILQAVTPLSGSLVLALALVEKEIDADALYKAARVEELHKAEIYDEEKYGPDPHQEKKDAAVKRDLEAAARYLALLKPAS